MVADNSMGKFLQLKKERKIKSIKLNAVNKQTIQKRLNIDLYI